MKNNIKIFSGRYSKDLAIKISNYLNKDLAKMDIVNFKDGEMNVYIGESVRDSNCFVIQSLPPNSDNIMEFLLIGDALKRSSAKNIIGVIPYLGYSRQDRKDSPRTAIGSRLLANLIETSGYDKIITLELHAEQIQGYYNIPLEHLYTSHVFTKYITELDLDNLVICSPDIGGSKRAKFFSDYFNTDLIICHKHRNKANSISEMKIIGDVKDKDVIIIDDIADTLGTVKKASELIMENGANTVRAMVTHPLLSDNAYENIVNSKLTEFITTDSLKLKFEHKKLKQLSISKMIGGVIRKINEDQSISAFYKSM